MPYSGRKMLGKHLHCHSVHVMADKYYSRHHNIAQAMKQHLWLKEQSAWFMFLAFHMGFGTYNVYFFFLSLTTLLFHKTWPIELPSHTLHTFLLHQVLP